jgi:hypothetical protein
MDNLNLVIRHLQGLDPGFYGQIVIRVRDGRAVLITEERNIKLAEQTDEHRE